MDKALAVLSSKWGIQSSIRQETSGGSRATWQLENGDWLSRCGLRNSREFLRETTLLELVNQKLSDIGANIDVPKVLQSLDGSAVVKERSGLWRLTRNIAGSKYKATDRRTYPALVQALRSLHLALKEVPDAAGALPLGVLDSVEKTKRAVDDHPLIAEVLSWTQSRISTLRRFPVLVTHGDFNPTNVLYKEEGGGLRL